MLDKIKGIVTGGTKGIGEAITLRLLAGGATVTAIYSRDEKAAQSLIEQAGEARSRLYLNKGSISDQGFATSATREAINTMGGMNLLVNNAGITKDNLFMDMTDDQWRQVMDVNLGGTFAFTMAALKHMKTEEDKGYVVNLASISGLIGRASQANYATSKGAILGMTKLLGKRHFKDGIQFHTIVPGIIHTPMVDKMPENLRNEILAATTAQRMGTPREIATIVSAIARGDLSYTVGNVIRADGGLV